MPAGPIVGRAKLYTAAPAQINSIFLFNNLPLHDFGEQLCKSFMIGLLSGAGLVNWGENGCGCVRGDCEDGE